MSAIKKNKLTPGMTDMVSRHRQRGVTLMELMTVMTIITIIASISYPSYTKFIVRAKRSAGTSMLLQIADRQQQFFMDNKQYAASMTNLGYANDSIMIGDDGKVLSATDEDRIYGIGLSNTTATTYTLTATPQLRQSEKDTDCGDLTLTQAGDTDSSGGGRNCW